MILNGLERRLGAFGGLRKPPQAPSLALVWGPEEASAIPQMPPNGVLSRLRSFEGYCSFWEAYRSSQMLVIVNDSGPHLGTGSLSIFPRHALV